MSRREKRRQKWVSLFLLSVFAFSGTLIFSPGEAKAVTVAEAQRYGVKIAAGYYHSLALKADGRVIAWGYNGYGECNVPAEAQSGVVAVAADGNHSLALKADGRVIAWGLNDAGQCNVPAEAQSGVVAIAAGGYHSLALKADGRVIAWGYNGHGRCDVPAEAQSGVVAIAAGYYHSLALKADGRVIAWGYNNYGQCNVPADAQSGVVAIAGGSGWHSLALKADGRVIAWGLNGNGQCNVSSDAQSGVVAIAGGGYHSLALKADGRVIAWGDNGSGQCNVPADLVVVLNLLPRLDSFNYPTQYYDNEDYTFSFKATDPDPHDTTLTTDIYVNTTKVQSITSANGETKNVTIDKSKIPIGDSFTLKLEIKDLIGGVSTVTKTITRSNRAPTVTLKTCPSSIHKLDNLTFTFNASDADTRIDTTLTNEIYVGSTLVQTITTNNGADQSITIDKSKLSDSFTLKVTTKDKKGATATATKTITRYNNAPTIAFTSCPTQFTDTQSYVFKFKANDTDSQDTSLKTDILINGSKLTGGFSVSPTATVSSGTITTAKNTEYTVTINASSVPAADSFTIKLETVDLSNAKGSTSTNTITRSNRAPTVTIKTCPSSIHKLDNLTFTFNASDADTRIDTTLTNEIYIGSTKVDTVTTNNGADKSITIDKSKLSDSFTLKVITKDKKGATNTATKAITRYNNAPTIAFTSCPTQFTDTQSYVFKFKASDTDSQDTSLKTNILINGSKLTGGFNVSPTATVSSGTITTAKNTEYTVTINASSVPAADSFTIKLETKDNSGAVGSASKTITRSNRAPSVSFVSTPNFKDNVDYTFSYKATDPDTRVDATLTTDVYVGTTKVASAVSSGNGSEKSVTIDKSKIPAAESFTLKVITKDKNGATSSEVTKTINRDNQTPSVSFVSTPNFKDNESYTFSYKATDPDTRVDATLTTDVYVGSTKVATAVSSSNGVAKSVTIAKASIPVADSFTLKVVTKDKNGATAEKIQTINRENRVPTIDITNYPTDVHRRENNLSFKITVSDLDKRIDPVLTTNIELDESKVSEADFEISPVVSVSNGNIPANNGTTYQVTIRNKTKYISTNKDRFTLNVITKDTCGATNNKSITINNFNNDPRITLSKTELSLADGKIPKHDQTFSFKITASDSDTIDQNLNVKFYIIIEGKSTEVTTFRANSQNITNGNLIATNNQTYTITIDKTIPAENPLIPNTVNNFTLKAVVTDDLFSTDDDQIELIHFNTPPEIEVLGLTTDVSNTVRKSDNILSFGLILKDKDAADTEIKCEMYVKVLDTEQKVNQFTVDAITNNTGTLTGQNGKKYEITLNKAVFVPMFASDFSIKFVATDTCGDKIEKEIFFTHYTDIIAQWALDSVKDNVAVDSGGQSNNGIVHGATLTTGIIGYGYSFNGTNDYVEVPLSPTLSGAITTNSFSVETWVKTTDTPSGNIGLVTNYGTNTTPFWKLGLEGASKKFHFELRDKQGNYATVAAPTALNDGNWHHLVGVRDAEQRKIRLYVDGVLVGEEAAPPGDVNSGQSIFFGFHSNRYFQGCLDEVTLYGCALSAEEVRKNYEKIVYLTDLTMTNRYDDESTHPCTYGIFMNKLDFELKKTVNDLVIELEIPSSIKIREILSVSKKDAEGNYVSIIPVVGERPIADPSKVSVTENGIISFTQPLDAGSYRIELLLTVDEHLIIKSKAFYDESKIKINNDREIFWFEYMDFKELPNVT